MSIQDDYFDTKAYLVGTLYEEAFDRFSRWAFRLEEERDALREDNETLREAIRIVGSEGLREDERVPRRNEVEIEVPASDPVGVGALGAFLVDDAVDEGVLARYGLDLPKPKQVDPGPLSLVSARRDGDVVRFRFRRPS